MAIVDSILMELDQEAKTTQRVLDRIPEDKLTWKPHAKSYSLGQLALHIARGQGFLADAVSKDTFEIGDMSQPRTRRAGRKFWTRSRKAPRTPRKPLRNWTMRKSWPCGPRRRNGKVIYVRAADRIHSRHSPEPYLSSSRPAFRLSPLAGCAGAFDLRPQRGRKSVRLVGDRPGRSARADPPGPMRHRNHIRARRTP